MRTRIALLASLAGLAVSSAAQAQQTFFNYTGPDFGNWNSGANWTPFGIPSVALHVPLIPGGKTVRFGTGAPGAITIDKMQIDHGGQVEILNDYDMTIRTQTDGTGTIGLLSLSGILFMSAVGNGTDLRLSGPGGSYLTVGGTPGCPNLISMSNSVNNQIYGTTGLERFDLQPGSSIEGAGRIGLNFLQIANMGSIIAKGSSGLTIDPSAAGLANLGGLLAADTGDLVLAPAPYNNQGTIRSMTGTVLLTNCDITGGTFESTGAGRIQVNAAGAGTILRGITNNGIIRLPNDADCYLLGGMTNNATIEMLAAGNGTDFYFGDNYILSGTGTIALSNSVNNQFYDVTGGQQGRTLTNAGNTITGSGRLGLNTISIVNQAAGSILATSSSGITIDPGNTFINEGTLRAESGSFLNLLVGSYTFTAPAVAGDGGVILFTNGTHTGLIDSEGTGVCRLNAAGAGTVFNNLTNLGVLDFPNDTDATFTGTLSNQGRIDMRAAGNGTDMYLASNLLLTGAGTIALSNSVNNQIYDVTGGQQGRTLTNVSNTITGSGRLGLNTISIVNQAAGSILATSSSGITIDPGNTFVNQGVLRAESGSFLNLLVGSYTFTAAAVAGDGGVILFTNGTHTGIIDSEGTGVCRLNAAGAGTVFNNLTNLGVLDFPNDTDATFTGTLSNQGRIDMRAAGNGTDMYLASNLLLTGGGTIALSNSVNNQIYDVTGGQQGRTLTNAGNTITGSGRLGLNTISIVNQAAGSILATSSSGITIDPGNTFINEGTLRAESGSFLNLVTGSYTFTAAAVAGTGGVVFFTNGTYTGTIDSEGTGVCRLNAAGAGTVFNTLTNLGVLDFPNDTDATFSGTLSNQGLIDMRAAGNGTDFYLSTNLLLTGGGTIALSNSVNNQIYDVTGGQQGRTLTNVNNTITGSGRLGLNTISIVNQAAGSILATSSSGITIDPGNTFINEGTLIASGGTVTIHPGTFTTSGNVAANAGRLIHHAAPGNSWVQTGGQVLANGEIQVDSNSYLLQGGTLGGSGLLDSNVINSGGEVAPGQSPGLLTIEGTYTQQAGGLLTIEVAGEVVGTELDRLAITGAAALGGTLRINRQPGYFPDLGTQYTILTCASRTGTFSTVEPFGAYTVQYNPTSVVITVTSIICIQEYNGDGVLNPDDLGDFITDYYTPPPVPGPGGYAILCPENDPPYDQGYKAAFTPDGLGQCSEPFPDNLGDYITAYFTGC